MLSNRRSAAKLRWKFYFQADGIVFHKHVPVCEGATTLKTATFLAKQGTPSEAVVGKVELVPAD